MPVPRALSFIGKEIRELLPPTLFFAAGFNLIVLTGHMLVADYNRALFNFTVATTTALVIGKSVLLANALPGLRRFDGAPLIIPILFKTLVYTLVVTVLRLLEAVIEAWVTDGDGFLAVRSVESRFSWHQFIAVQLWIVVLFLIYVTADELNTLFGEGALRQIFFTWSAPDLKSSRQQRMRALAQITRLAREHGVETLRERPSAPGDELFRLIDRLGRQPRGAGRAHGSHGT